MHKSSTKCNEIVGKWCKNKHGASKIIDTLETYQPLNHGMFPLEMLLVSIRKGLIHFLYLSKG
jgi:hypothetical protein